MPCVKRNAAGDIIALTQCQIPGSDEQLPPNHPEVLAFLQGSDNENDVKNYLNVTDLELARVVEDLIDILIAKNLLMLTDLPDAAREKLLNRRKIRDSMKDVTGLMVEQEDIL